MSVAAAAASTSTILRYILSEILREIPVKLPVKSLLRFSTVSTSWLSMISESRFAQEHKRRAAVERMVTMSSYNFLDGSIFVCRIPPASSTAIGDSTPLICPVEGTLRHLRASCDGLWLVEAQSYIKPVSRQQISGEIERILYLWNHSTGRHRKLSDPSIPTTRTRFVYGLGYDSAAEDYKVLKIARKNSSHSDHPIQTEVYSLKSDSWKMISAPPTGVKQERFEYVNGAFHWLPTSSNNTIISSFSLSSEKYGEVAFPAVALDGKDVEVVVTRGKLCVSANNGEFHPDGFGFALWVMEEYGVQKSWTKMLNIEKSWGSVEYDFSLEILRPIYFYENGDILFNASHVGLCIYKNEGALFNWIVGRDGRTKCEGYVSVETLISPLPINDFNC